MDVSKLSQPVKNKLTTNAQELAACEWELNRNSCQTEFSNLDAYKSFRVAQELGLTK